MQLNAVTLTLFLSNNFSFYRDISNYTLCPLSKDLFHDFFFKFTYLFSAVFSCQISQNPSKWFLSKKTTTAFSLNVIFLTTHALHLIGFFQ